MTEVVIVGPSGDGLAQKVSSELARRCDGVCVTQIPAVTHPIDTDVALILPGYTVGTGEEKLRCRILMLPGGTGTAFARADCVVTYGMNAKDTLTLSSIGDETCVLALQRELVTAPGGVLDRQEIKIRAAETADELLAVNGAMLLLGLPAADLSDGQ